MYLLHIFFINMFKILSTNNVRLFFNTLSHVRVNIFLSPYHGVSSINLICHVVGYDSIKKFMSLTYLIKLVS
jgi:hypothetical protein